MSEIVYDPSKEYVKARVGEIERVYEVLAEDGGCLWIRRADSTNVGPFTFSRDRVTPFTPPPVEVQAGDIVSNGKVDAYEYRVLGVTDTQMLIVKREDYADGDWPTLDGSHDFQQKEVRLGQDLPTTVFIRPNPDKYLKFKSRP